MRPHHTRSAGGPTYIWHPSYSNPTTITEGNTGSYYIQTTNVPNGTTLYWSITHGTTTSADFSSNSGSFTVNSNLGQFNIFPTSDNTQDGGETFTLTVRTESTSGPIVLSRSITINDPAPYATVSIEGGQIEEGNSHTVTVYIYNVYSNDTYYWQIQDNYTDSNDWNSPTSGTFTTSNAGSYRIGSFTINPKSDGIVDMNEYFGFYIVNNSTGYVVYNNYWTAQLIDPQPYAQVSIEYGQFDGSSPINVDVYIYNVNANYTYNWSLIFSQTNSADWSGNTSGNFTTYNAGTNRIGSFTLYPNQNSENGEGSEYFGLSIYSPDLGYYIYDSGYIAQLVEFLCEGSFPTYAYGPSDILTCGDWYYYLYNSMYLKTSTSQWYTYYDCRSDRIMEGRYYIPQYNSIWTFSNGIQISEEPC
jgi:hypothetical protein